MSSSTPRRQRLRGRLGIDVGPPPVALPPLHASPRRVRLPQQQHEERTQLVEEFRQRLASTRACGLDLAPLHDAVRHALDHSSDDALAKDDCFSCLQQVLARVAAPFLRQFLSELVLAVETLAHDKRQREAREAAARPHRKAHDDAAAASDASSASSVEFSPESSDEQEPVLSIPQHTPDAQDLRHVPTRAVFRTTLRSRQFPASRVATAEFVYRTSAFLPFDRLQRPRDCAALRLQGHNDQGSAQWRVLVFPKSRPSWRDHDERAAFIDWARAKLHDQQPQQQQQQSSRCTDATSVAAAQARFRDALAVKELVCYELCRLVFDKCPTTARFLHGLFQELVDVTLRALASAEREQQIMEQRHRNVHLELARLHDKLLKVHASFATLEDTLATRQQRLLRTRELIIRKRKQLNLLLSADQVLMRRLVALIHHAQELADDVRPKTPTHNSVPSPSSSQQAEPLAQGSRLANVDELVALVLDKYASLPQVHETRVKEAAQRAAKASSAVASSMASHEPAAAADPELREIIVLDANDLQSAVDEYRATLLRLSRMLSTKSPDSSTGWDAQELWDQVLFIPPHEDVQDLESDVQRLCLHVEARIVAQRHRRATPGSVRTLAVQTDIRACTSGPTNSNRRSRLQPSDHERWRPRPSTHDAPPSSPKTPVIPTWKWQRVYTQQKRRRALMDRVADQLAETKALPRGGLAPPTPTATTTTEQDHGNLRATIVPLGFRAFIRAIPRDYTPHQLSLHDVHSVISYLFNGVWMLVQEDFHRPLRFSTPSSTPDARLIPLATIHEYIYRIYLQHFHVESVVTSRLLDLLVSASRLDTQSCKIQLFCRLLGVPGVTPFPRDGFWFVLKALHVLQRCCGTTGGYFLLDAEGDNEFVPQASAADALSQLFAGSSNEVLKRLRLKLSGLASVYGMVWIPAYNILTFIMDEWQAGQDALRLLVEDKLFVEHTSETDPFTGLRTFTNEHSVVTFSEFLHGFAIVQLHVNRSEALQAYRQLLLDSTVALPSSSAASAVSRIDRHRFYVNWMQLILHALNVSQQQMLRPQNAPAVSAFLGGLSHHNTSSGREGGSGSGPVGPGVQLGAVADALVTANQQLAYKFLVLSWEQMKPDVIRRLDAKFNDVGQQMRLVQQMDAALHRQSQPTLPHQPRDDNSAWRSFHQLIQVAYTHTSA